MPKTGKRSTAVWYCEECTPEAMRESEPCGLCCGYRVTCTMQDLTEPQRDALGELHRLQRDSGRAWHSSWLVDKRALYALERRGLVVLQRYQAVAKLTPAGARLAGELVDA